MGRPKSSPEHREAKRQERREQDKERKRKVRAKDGQARAIAGEPAAKRGRPRDGRADFFAGLFEFAHKQGYSVKGLASDLTKETGRKVTPNELSQAMHRARKARKKGTDSGEKSTKEVE
jgi:hypothetical protein